jgi:segregation and condensation protein A
MIAQIPSVKLDRFEGPLDLLLYLIQREEIDIHDIPISQITRHYLSALEQMQSLNLEIAGEFILMVSYLLYIKVQMLLPRQQIEGEEISDPRLPLAQKLLEYQKFKQIGEEFKRLEIERSQYFPHCFNPANVGFYENLKSDVSAFDLYQAYLRALKASPTAPAQTLPGPVVDITERLDFIRNLIRQKARLSFSELTEGLDRLFLVATFIALLELIKRNELFIRQSRLFGNIIVYRRDYAGA